MALEQSYALSAVEERTAPAHFLPQRVQRTRLERLLQGRTWTALRVGFDVLLVAFAVGVTVLRAPSASADEIWLAALLAPLMIGTLTLGGLYKHDFQVKIVDGVGRVIGATTLAAAATITAAATGTTQLESHALIPHTWAAASVLLVVGRVFTNWVERRARAAGVIATPTLIVGAGQIGALVERRLTSERELGLHPVGYLDADPPEQEDVPLRTAPVLGRPEEVGRVAELTGAKHVVIGFTRDPDSQLFDVMRDCEARKLQVSVVPRFFEFVNVHSELEHIGGLPLFSHESTDPKGNTFAVKHAFDRVAAGLMLLILLPVLLTVAAAVKLSSPGPVLFRQRRIGRDGRHFELLKFRSMRMADPVAAEDTLTLLPTDMAPGGVEGMDRRTRRGRVPAPQLDRRASSAHQRPVRRHEPRRPAPRAARVRRDLRAAGEALRRPAPRQVGHHRLGADQRPARPDVPERPHRARQPLHLELVAVARPEDPLPHARRGADAPRGVAAGDSSPERCTSSIYLRTRPSPWPPPCRRWGR